MEPVSNVGLQGDPVQGRGAVFMFRVLVFQGKDLPLERNTRIGNSGYQCKLRVMQFLIQNVA